MQYFISWDASSAISDIYRHGDECLTNITKGEMLESFSPGCKSPWIKPNSN